MSTDVALAKTASTKSLRINKKVFNVLNAKAYSHPWESRSSLSDRYENPVSLRESWWRCNIRVTPIPGSYEHASFLNDLDRKPNSYRFKSDGRKLPSDFSGHGALLLPGGYKHYDFIDNLSRKPATYRFKAEERDAFDVLNFGKKDKDITVSPNTYGIEHVLAVDGEKAPAKNYMFRSGSKRFPTKNFKPKEGPSPGTYSVKDITPKATAVTSSFRSKTPRFHSSHTYTRKKVPGPGSYAKAFQHPLPPTISKMGRQYGLFFTSEFQT